MSLGGERGMRNTREPFTKEAGFYSLSPMVSVEYRWQVADGTYHWLLDRAVLQPSSNGRSNEIAGFWLDITDITER